jgi:hypothetical protein
MEWSVDSGDAIQEPIQEPIHRCVRMDESLVVGKPSWAESSIFAE